MDCYILLTKSINNPFNIYYFMIGIWTVDLKIEQSNGKEKEGLTQRIRELKLEFGIMGHKCYAFPIIFVRLFSSFSSSSLGCVAPNKSGFHAMSLKITKFNQYAKEALFFHCCWLHTQFFITIIIISTFLWIESDEPNTFSPFRTQIECV